MTESSLALPRIVSVQSRCLVVHQDFTVDEAEGLALQLTMAGQDIKWALGDLYIYMSAQAGDLAAQIIPEGQEDNYQRYVKLCLSYPQNERGYDCNWSVYWYLRNHDQREEWLQRAETNHWTVAQLKEAMQEGDVIERVNWRERAEYLEDCIRTAAAKFKGEVGDYLRGVL